MLVRCVYTKRFAAAGGKKKVFIKEVDFRLALFGEEVRLELDGDEYEVVGSRASSFVAFSCDSKRKKPLELDIQGFDTYEELKQALKAEEQKRDILSQLQAQAQEQAPRRRKI